VQYETTSFARGHRGGIFTTVTPASASTASERGGELPRPIPDHDPELVGPLSQINQQIADLLRRARPVRIRPDTEDMHIAAGDLDHDEDIQPSPGHRAVHREEIARQHGRRLSA